MGSCYWCSDATDVAFLLDLVVCGSESTDETRPAQFRPVVGACKSGFYYYVHVLTMCNGNFKDKGSESDKNERALVVIKRILSNPVWMNAHILPHDTYVFEIRQEEGYGARWTADGTFFRGFLEVRLWSVPVVNGPCSKRLQPQMEEGHSVGWKH